MRTIIIVEGKSDTRRLKEIYPNIITFQTSGLGIDDAKIEQLLKLEKQGVNLICLTDPDYPGERIRSILSQRLKSLQHAYISRSKSRAKNGKIGVENADANEIKRALDNVLVQTENQIIYDTSFMIDAKLHGDKMRREQFCDKIGIAFGNNKKVLKQLNSFGIPIDNIKKTLKELDEGNQI